MMNRINSKLIFRTPTLRRRFASNTYRGPSVETGAKRVLPFVDDAEDYDPNLEYKRFSLNDFYSSLADFKLTD
jgi:hypothetical protein